MEINEKKVSAVFKAFCDENRIKILKLLVTGEKCACELNEKINVSQPTMSHHMKILCDSGVVSGRREGKWTTIPFHLKECPLPFGLCMN